MEELLIKKKICMLGAFAVGKTSLVRRYVENIFSEKYQTTIGVKIDKKTIMVEDRAMALVLWDLSGKDSIFEIRTSYLRGASGYLLVVDKIRKNTLDLALDIHKMAQDILGDVPFLLLINLSCCVQPLKTARPFVQVPSLQLWSTLLL